MENPKRTPLPGFSIGAEEHKLGIRGSSTTTLSFDDLAVDLGQFIGEPAKGLDLMNEILAIAKNTFKEAIRNRILYVILMFALFLIGFSGVLSQLSIADPIRTIKNMGFMSIDLFGVAIAIFVGVSLVYNELEKKTIYTIVSEPIGSFGLVREKIATMRTRLAVCESVVRLTTLLQSTDRSDIVWDGPRSP